MRLHLIFAVAVLSSAICFCSFAADEDVHPIWNDESQSLRMIMETIDQSDNDSIRAALLRGILDGLSGRRRVQPPETWDAVRDRLLENPSNDVRSLTTRLSQLFGDSEAQKLAVAMVSDIKRDPRRRLQALRSLISQKAKGTDQLILSLLDEDAMRLAAIRSAAAIESPAIAQALLKRHSSFDAASQKAIIETLASRKSYAAILLGGLDRGVVDQQQIPPHVARSMKLILGDSFEKVFGQVRELQGDRVERMNHYKSLLSPERLAKADAHQGRVVYEATCASCHTLYGTGGKVGPDLTGSNRANLDYILLNSVDPSYDVPEGYKMVIIQTTDGRVVNGVVAREDNQRVVLKTPQQPEVVLLKEDIEARKISDKSMMPDGQLDQLKPQQVANLIKYLQTTQQVPKP